MVELHADTYYFGGDCPKCRSTLLFATDPSRGRTAFRGKGGVTLHCATCSADRHFKAKEIQLRLTSPENELYTEHWVPGSLPPTS